MITLENKERLNQIIRGKVKTKWWLRAIIGSLIHPIIDILVELFTNKVKPSQWTQINKLIEEIDNELPSKNTTK